MTARSPAPSPTTSTPTPPNGLPWRLARLTAPMTRAFAGRRRFPLWAVVHHRGRTTGRALTVPVAVRARPGEFLIPLPWGTGTNWARNVLAADGCVVRWKGEDHGATAPRLIGPEEARAYFSRLTWAGARRIFHAESFLLLRREDPPARA